MESEYITGPLPLIIVSPSLAYSPLLCGRYADCHLNFPLEVSPGLILATT